MHLIGVFAKYWQAGKVKTRLAQSISASKQSPIGLPLAQEIAKDLYYSFLETTLKQVSSLSESGKDVEFAIGYSPIDQKAAFQELVKPFPGRWHLLPQSDGDLGHRMDDFFRKGFQMGARSVILIGSDCPQIDQAVFFKGLDLLENKDLIFGPAEDGGYYLVGCRKHCPEIFQGIQWSTETVLENTLSKAALKQRSIGLLEKLFDLDDRTALQKFTELYSNQQSKENTDRSCLNRTSELAELAEKIRKIL